jgi:hypothetical protein
LWATQTRQRAAAEFERALRSLARVRALVMGTQLRRHLTALADGTVAEAPLEAVAHRTGEHFFVKPGADAVTLVRASHSTRTGKQTAMVMCDEAAIDGVVSRSHGQAVCSCQ